uniref:Uncharacterized protein n=1 Tax=Steinernema glaseri TaxID=37863 RepID=A0A1I7Z098_9BILA
MLQSSGAERSRGAIVNRAFLMFSAYHLFPRGLPRDGDLPREPSKGTGEGLQRDRCEGDLGVVYEGRKKAFVVYSLLLA